MKDDNSPNSDVRGDDSDRIAANPSLQELADSAEKAKAIGLFCDLAKKAGLNSPSFDEVLEAAPGLSEKMDELVKLPDAFNFHFADRGWIAHESMNVELAKSAVEAAQLGDVKKGEAMLISHYDAKTIDFVIFRCKWIDAFQRPRQSRAPHPRRRCRVSEYLHLLIWALTVRPDDLLAPSRRFERASAPRSPDVAAARRAQVPRKD